MAMDTLIKVDIFFFITAIAVVLISIVFLVVLVYLIKILRDVKYISKRAKTEADLITGDLSALRKNIKEKGIAAKHFFSFFSSLYKKHKPR